MLSAFILAIAIVSFVVLFFTSVIRRREVWSATETPLASIMGSGFLVCAPLLASLAGIFSWFKANLNTKLSQSSLTT